MNYNERRVMMMRTKTATRGLENDELMVLAPSVFAERPAESTSGWYKQVPTVAVIDRMRDSGWLPVRATENRVMDETRQGFQRHMVRFARRDDLGVMRSVGDVRPEVVLINSHDGKSSFQVSLGLFRMVCSNGLMVAQGGTYDRKINHIGFDPASVVSASSDLIEMAPELIGTSETWQKTRIEVRQRMAFGKAALALVSDVEQTDYQSEEITRPTRNSDDALTVWGVYNVAQERLMSGRVRLRTKSGSTLKRQAVKSISTEASLNRALWTLASELAKSAA